MPDLYGGCTLDRGGDEGGGLRSLGRELAEVSRPRVLLKAGLLASSLDMYHKGNAVAEGAPKP